MSSSPERTILTSVVGALLVLGASKLILNYMATGSFCPEPEDFVFGPGASEIPVEK